MSDPLTETRALLKAATPGEWATELTHGDITCDDGSDLGYSVLFNATSWSKEADSRLVAAAPRLLAVLADQLETATAQRDKARGGRFVGCTCGERLHRIKADGPDPECEYHALAALRPWDHSIPWNCPTFYDGCNCRETREYANKLDKGIAALHVPIPDDPGFCAACTTAYPCATRKLLDEPLVAGAAPEDEQP